MTSSWKTVARFCWVRAGELVKTVLIPRVNLLVVNVDEAKALTGIAVSSGESLADTARVLLGMGLVLCWLPVLTLAINGSTCG